MILENKTAVVTGGTKGIGYAIAENLATAGASVFICGRIQTEVDTAVDSLSSVGRTAGRVCDVRNEEQVRQMLDAATRAFGGVDILVNNAGMGIFGKTVEETSGDEFRQTIETNLIGVFYSCNHAIPLMRQRGGGYIINISSLAGQNAHPRMAAYNASKCKRCGILISRLAIFALAALTRILAATRKPEKRHGSFNPKTSRRLFWICLR